MGLTLRMSTTLMAGKTALVTGAANGIGAAIAELFGQEGARVWLLDKDKAGLVRRTDEFRKSGISAQMCLADLARPDEVVAAVAEIHREIPSLDVLVNNAGADPRRPFLEMTEEEWLRTLDTNLNAAYRCTRCVVPQMVEVRRGKIIQISSVTFHWGLKNLTHYISAKGAMVGFTRALARELGEFNIHVNCITPGAVLTEREARVATLEQAAAVVSLQSLQRRIVPLDIARTCVFLATELSDGITGQTINVDGGWVMH
jgi:3-oxoacyl-[acyl-carrier protein] reductase